MRIKAIDGKPVMDAKRPITLIVNDNDIARADRNEPADCAMARACRRQLHAKEVRVHLGRVYVRTTPDHWTRYITPRSLRSEIIAFDRGGTFEPGEFKLAIPGPSRALGRGTGTNTNRNRNQRKGKAPKKRRPPHVVTNVRNGPA